MRLNSTNELRRAAAPATWQQYTRTRRHVLGAPTHGRQPPINAAHNGNPLLGHRRSCWNNAADSIVPRFSLRPP
jgi:hypothetical protein